MTIESVVVRQRVEDLDAAVPFYEKLTGSNASRFSFAGVAATLGVANLDAVVEEAVAGDAEVAAPSAPTPNGHRAVLRHPHGGVYEYVGP
ncbi:VOC family protein [Streptomyces sp. NPDC059850]|uniref:VOC family protein n=1 Tax=Streptomyces sp. NPDC059850 TaxID=3346970 RepID=UPI003657AA5C